MKLMGMVKYPYNISKASQEAVLKALEQPVDGQVKVIVEERGRLAGVISAMDFVMKVWPSDANFLLVKVEDADRLYEFLIGEGIIVRNRNRVRSCAGCLRMTVGRPEENDALIAALEKYSKQRKG